MRTAVALLLVALLLPLPFARGQGEDGLTLDVREGTLRAAPGTVVPFTLVVGNPGGLSADVRLAVLPSFTPFGEGDPVTATLDAEALLLGPDEAREVRGNVTVPAGAQRGLHGLRVNATDASRADRWVEMGLTVFVDGQGGTVPAPQPTPRAMPPPSMTPTMAPMPSPPVPPVMLEMAVDGTNLAFDLPGPAPTLFVNVSHRGASPVRALVEVQGGPEGLVPNGSAQEVTVPPNGTVRLSFPLAAPPGLEPGFYSLTVQAREADAEGPMTVRPVFVQVRAAPLHLVDALRVEGLGRWVNASPGERGEGTIVFRNSGLRPVDVVIVPGALVRPLENGSSEPAFGFEANLTPRTFRVAPGGLARVTAWTQAPAGAPLDAVVSMNFTFAATDGRDNLTGQGSFRTAVVAPEEAVAPLAAPEEEPAGGLGAAIASRPGAVAGVALGCGALGVALLMRREHARYALLGGVLPLYARIMRSEMLEHEAREELHRLIHASPGIHYSALKAETRLNTGALVHHLRSLEREKLVTSRREGPHRRFYPPGAPLPAPGPTLTPMQARILDLLREEPLDQSALAERLGLSQQGVSYHLKTLERQGRLVATRESGRVRYQPILDLEVLP